MANQAGKAVVDPEARGILLSLLAMGAAESALERLDENRRSVCVEAWQEHIVASEVERGRILGELRAEAVSTLPRGLDRLHPSWIGAALEVEPASILQIALADLPQSLRATVLGLPGIALAGSRATLKLHLCSAAVKREVVRVALGWLAPLCESDCGPLAEGLCALAFDDLVTEATRRGAYTVGQSLAGATPALRARAMAAAGETWAQVIGKASAKSTSDADRKIAMVHANTRIPESARTPSERLLHIGLAVLISELATEHPGSLYRVAGRLPASLGRPMVGW